MAVRIDLKILLGGAAMLAAGIIISLYLGSVMPIGTPGMTEEQAALLILEQRENEDFNTLSGILMGVGFLLILISFGARRKRKGGAALRKREKKPAQ